VTEAYELSHAGTATVDMFRVDVRIHEQGDTSRLDYYILVPITISIHQVYCVPNDIFPDGKQPKYINEPLPSEIDQFLVSLQQPKGKR
jgi:hypothetical protein